VYLLAQAGERIEGASRRTRRLLPMQGQAADGDGSRRRTPIITREGTMAKTAHDIVESQRFKALVRKRWSVSIVLTILLFVLYYGYILVVAYAKPLLAVKVGTYTTLGIVLARSPSWAPGC